MKTSILWVGLLLAVPTTATADTAEQTPVEAAVNGSDWVVDQANHVSGVSSAHQITNPAKISYDSLMDDTSEMKELKKKGIKKDSARGQVLVSSAKDRVRRAAKAAMVAKGHCSVWKKIKSKRGVKVVDLTEEVRKRLND